MDEVKLFGSWPSPFSYRVIWALKLKGISYEYVEEDLSNKSPLLLHYNPIHKKIPVLVHAGKPICESTIILEYIEDTWPQNPLLPIDPCKRATARFWIKFMEEKGPAMWFMFRASGKKPEKAKKDTLEMLKIIEEMGLRDFKEKKFFGGDKVNLVDIALGSIAHWLGVIEDVVGIKLLEAEKFPRLYAWIKNFKEVPLIKENLPDRDEMLIKFKLRRAMILAAS